LSYEEQLPGKATSNDTIQQYRRQLSFMLAHGLYPWKEDELEEALAISREERGLEE
jgi:hypothetical protein